MTICVISVGVNYLKGREVLYYENHNLTDVVTPVRVDILEKLLKDSNYNKEDTDFLVDGFSNGFSLGYEGPENVKITAPNLKFRGVGDEIELWNKVMKEVKLGRYAGPFDKPPFEHFIQSPIGLVPKDGGKKYPTNFSLVLPPRGNHLCQL